VYITSIPFETPLYIREDSAYFLNSSDAWVEIVGPASNVACPNKTNASLEASTIWNKQLIYAADPSTVLPHRIYCTEDSPKAFLAQTLGLPALASSPTLTPDSAGTTFSYVYSFHYELTFVDYEGTSFTERGPITTVSATSAVAIAGGGAADMNISAIPVLANASSTNYVVSTTLKIRIARTVNNGSTFYYVGQVDNGTTTYTDNTPDATLDDGAVLYTDGGVLDYNQPPAATKYLTQVNSFFWYATERIVTHSIQGAPGACPDEYYQYSDQKIIGLNSTISFPVLFTDGPIYRLDGVYDEFGDGGFDFREIHPSAGCVSNRSIVRVPGGLVWAGNGGFYFTDGNTVEKISYSIERRYKQFKNASISGSYDTLKNIVFWAVSNGNATNLSPNDTILALHLNFGLSKYSVFTTLSSENNVFPTCLAYTNSLDVAERFRDKLLIGESRGYLMIQSDNSFADDVINTDVFPSAFKRKAVRFWWESVAMDLGTDASRKYCNEITAVFRQETELAAQFFSRRDDGGPWAGFSEIRKDGALIWAVTQYPWNDTADTETRHDWNALPIVDGKRHFPAGTLRSTRRQLALTNSYTWVARSDDFSTVTTDTALKYVTLNNAALLWPDECEDYYLYFNSDSYVTGYKIKDRLSDTVVQVFDPFSNLPAGATLKWQMRGYRKNERAYLESVTIHFSDDSVTQTPNRGTSGLVNA
jgi:hypothetical protein